MSANSMTHERALNNAIVSAEMEGFTVTAEQKTLMKKILSGKISLNDAILEINRRYPKV